MNDKHLFIRLLAFAENINVFIEVNADLPVYINAIYTKDEKRECLLINKSLKKYSEKNLVLVRELGIIVNG